MVRPSFLKVRKVSHALICFPRKSSAQVWHLSAPLTQKVAADRKTIAVASFHSLASCTGEGIIRQDAVSSRVAVLAWLPQHTLISCFDVFYLREAGSAPDQVRGKLLPENAMRE
jgi:hypothetical protein